MITDTYPSIAQDFGPEIDVSLDNPRSYILEDAPRIAVSGPCAVAVWELLDGGNKAAWKYSMNGGKTWKGGGLFGREDDFLDGVYGFPSVCVDGDGNFCVATMYQRNLTGGGQTIVTYHGIVEADSIKWTGPSFVVPFVDPFVLDLPFLDCDAEAGILYLTFTHHETDAGLHSVSETYLAISRDGVWSSPRALGGPSAVGPRLVVDLDGSVFVMWHDVAGRRMLGRRSTDHGATFGEPIVVAQINANFSVPPGYQGIGRAYDIYCGGTQAPNFPSIAIDRSHGPHRGWMYAVWPECVTGTPEPVTASVPEHEPNNTVNSATHVQINQEFYGTSISPDLGDGYDLDTFSFEGHEGVTIRLTGRITGVSPPSRYTYCGTGIYLFDPGYLWATGGMDQGAGVNPPLIFTLPADAAYYTAFVAGGRENIAYEFRLERLIPSAEGPARDHRDIILVSSQDGGLTWSRKRLVNDDPPRFDNCIPEVAVDDLGRVHVTWYDRRDDPVRGMNYNIYWTCSEDGGETFKPSVRLSETQAIIRPIKGRF